MSFFVSSIPNLYFNITLFKGIVLTQHQFTRSLINTDDKEFLQCCRKIGVLQKDICQLIQYYTCAGVGADKVRKNKSAIIIHGASDEAAFAQQSFLVTFITIESSFIENYEEFEKKICIGCLIRQKMLGHQIKSREQS